MWSQICGMVAHFVHSVLKRSWENYFFWTVLVQRPNRAILSQILPAWDTPGGYEYQYQNKGLNIFFYDCIFFLNTVLNKCVRKCKIKWQLKVSTKISKKSVHKKCTQKNSKNSVHKSLHQRCPPKMCKKKRVNKKCGLGG